MNLICSIDLGWILGKALTMKIAKYWNRLNRDVLESPSVQVFNSRLNL